MSIPISVGTGAASVAAEAVAGLQYQQIQVLGKGGASVMAVNPDGTINTSIIGSPLVRVTGSIVTVGGGSVSGAVTVAGSVLLGSSDASVISIWKDSSVIAIATGSVVAIPAGNQSVSGTVGASVIGLVPIQPSNTSTISIFQNSSIFAVPTGNQSISGAINVSGSVMLGNSNASVITVLQGSSIFAVPTGNQSVSGALFVSGSVMLGNSNASIITIWPNASIAGTFVEDAAHATGDRGLNVFGVRNDTMASITSADGDYSPLTVGPVGEKIVANAPITRWVQGTADMRGPVTIHSVAVIAAQGSSVFTYVTGVQVVNFGPSSVIVTFSGATSSIIGYTIAPAGGGSNIVYTNALKTNANGAFAASISGLASVLVSAQGFISRT